MRRAFKLSIWRVDVKLNVAEAIIALAFLLKILL